MNYYQYGVVSPEQYKTKVYKDNLRKDTNRVGLAIIISEISTILLSLIISLFVNFSSISDKETSSLIELTESGFISLIALFIPALIIILCYNYNLNRLFPFSKISKSDLFIYIFGGLGVALASNYISTLFGVIFGSVGIDTSIDVTFEATTPLNIIFEFLTIAIIPAIVEEFLFRGVVLGVLKQYSEGLGIFISATLFALMHGNLTQIPFAFPIGLVLGYICVKTNSLLPGIIIHCLNNAFSVFLDLLYNNNYFSEFTTSLIEYSIILIIAILSFIALFLYIKKKKSEIKFTDSNNFIPFKEKMRISFSSPTIIIFCVYIILQSILVALVGNNI